MQIGNFMITGRLVFLAGAGLLGLTFLLAVIFAVRRPKYVPSSAAEAGAGGATAPLRNSYPTERATRVSGRARPKPADTGATELMPPGSAATELMPPQHGGDSATELMVGEETRYLDR